MAEQDKPFICYKSGWNLKFMPRNAVGWWALLLWLVALAIPTAAYVTGYVLLTVGWSLAMLRWMYLRSEVVDMNELLKLKRELDARNKR